MTPLEEEPQVIYILGSVPKSRWSGKIKQLKTMALKKEMGNNPKPDDIHSQPSSLETEKTSGKKKGLGEAPRSSAARD